MTLAPMETTPEQQMAAVWGLSSQLAAAASPQKPAPSRQRHQNAQPNKFRKGTGKEEEELRRKPRGAEKWRRGTKSG